MVVVALNLKTYPESFQSKSLDLLKAVCGQDTSHHLIVCPSLLDSAWMASVFEKTPRVSLFAQHADANG
ncbi:MAG TPA: hypothetical protein VI874_02445, partial [Candidatus Norongarragalinales archaeon]|nr:hypothetical protein [Candidatus Norongarragalinales archaeon]